MKRSFSHRSPGTLFRPPRWCCPRPPWVGACFDVEAADYDGDGRLDLYIANRPGADLLLLRR